MSEETSTRLTPTQLRWHCPTQALSFKTTADIESKPQVLGQEAAVEALQFGLFCHAKGQNVFVRGVPGSGRMTMVKTHLSSELPATRARLDRCYVNNFSQPDRPRLISLPAGTAQGFRRRLNTFIELLKELPLILSSEPYSSDLALLQEKVSKAVAQATSPLEKALASDGFAMVRLQQGQHQQPAILPLVDGEPVSPAKLQERVAGGQMSEQDYSTCMVQLAKYQKQLSELGVELAKINQRGASEVSAQREAQAREVLQRAASHFLDIYPQACVAAFIEDLIDDVVSKSLTNDVEALDYYARYGVNVSAPVDSAEQAPIIYESNPSALNLLGSVEPVLGKQGMAADYRGVRAGALLRADGGYLVIEVNDLMREPGAYVALMRTLRTGLLEMVPPDAGGQRPYLVLKPEAVDVQVKVVLIGDAAAFYQLNHLDSEFAEYFKVVVDVEDAMERSEAAIMQYARVLSHIAQDENLCHFDAAAVAALAEHGARIAANGGQLTARFGRIADIAREAAFLTQQAGLVCVGGEQVQKAISRTKERANMVVRRFLKMVSQGRIHIDTSGEVVGQINGLAVMSAGALTYGFPARITASIGVGQAGLINIEGRADMSGSIHTKGFQILGGLLRTLLKTEHSLAFSASIAFEQSYGGIDGDSASGAEAICLLSALTEIPIKQSMAITGAIDQKGHLQAIGGVNEKIEGFFDTCAERGLNGEQGVVIPASNMSDLMLRKDIVDAVAENRFHVHAVETIFQAMEVMTGVEAGEYQAGKGYPKGSLLHQAVVRAAQYYGKAKG